MGSEVQGKGLVLKVIQSVIHCDGENESQLKGLSKMKDRPEYPTDCGHRNQNSYVGIDARGTDFLSRGNWDSAEGTVADRESFMV